MSAAEVLAAAFFDDPMFVFIEPDNARRRRMLPWFFRAASRLGRQFGRIDIDGEQGVAIWLKPNTALGLVPVVRSGLVLAPLKMGRAAFRRFNALTSEFDAARGRIPLGPYWHLFILGVAPPFQGQGVGSRLIAPVLAEADRAAHDCYLETLEAENLHFYERHGFVVAEHVRNPGQPEFWAMVRRR